MQILTSDPSLECTNDECGMRCVGGQKRKGSEWWNEEVGRAVAEKRRAFEEWLQRRDTVTYDRYRAQRVAVKLAVTTATYDRYRAQRVAVKLAVQAAKRMAIFSDWGMISSVTKRCFGKR